EEAVNVRDEENTAASLIHACANGFLVAVEQGGFIHLNETDEVARSFAFAHQQGKAVGKGAFTHAVRSDQDDVTVDRLRENVNHVAQQVFAEVNRAKVAAFRSGDVILCGGVLADDGRVIRQ